jgi:hypothetical protein
MLKSKQVVGRAPVIIFSSSMPTRSRLTLPFSASRTYKPLRCLRDRHAGLNKAKDVSG